MKYVPLIIANLFRKKLRTALTIGSFAVALFLFGLLVVVRGAFNQGLEVAGADRLVVINKTSIIQPLPIAYRDRLVQIPGVKEVTNQSWFGGVYQDEKNFFAQMAIDDATFWKMYPEFSLDPGQRTAFQADREGVVVGAEIAKRFGWKIGDRVPIKGTIFPGTWEFNVRGIYHGTRPQDDQTQFLFHNEYLEERRQFGKGTIGWYVVRVDNPDNAVQVVKAVDNMFANSPWETKTDTEKSFAAGFVKQMGNIQLLILSIGGVVFFTLLLVTGNTMAIAVRERVRELAVLKAVGFTDTFVLALVLFESIFVAVIGAALGLAGIKVLTMGGDPTHGMLPYFRLPFWGVIFGFAVAIAVGLASGILPAFSASRLRVVDALRRI